MIRMIVSGGQTGVDRAALDAAATCGITTGGWCPKGRRAEDGVIPERYPLTETGTRDYAERTVLNVRDADATLILCRGRLAGGSLFTRDSARSEGRPVHVWSLVDPGGIRETRAWLRSTRPDVLNVAGPRESGEPGIHGEALAALVALLGDEAVSDGPLSCPTASPR